jgi:hypothetical protein
LVNICCAYRGSPGPEVTIRTLYTAGRLPTTAVEPAHRLHDEAQVPEREEPDAQGAAGLMRRLWKD